MNFPISAGVYVDVGLDRRVVMAAEHELMARVRERDAVAFDALAARYRELVRRHLLRTVRDVDAAEDLTQEVFLRLWTHAGQWHGSGSLKAWLLRIAMNLALNYLRTLHRRRQQPLETEADATAEEDESPAPAWMIDVSSLGPEALLEQAERHLLVRRLVGDLPPEKREVLRLVHNAEMEIREVAEKLGIPEGTVKSRLHYATKRLAHEWKAIAHEWEDIE